MKLKSTVAYAWQKVEQPMHTLTIKALAICLGMSVVFGSGVAPVKELMVQEVYAATQFADDAQIRDYSREAVESLVASKGIKGYPEDNTFRPDNSITRAEALSMIMNSIDPSGSARKNTADSFKNVSTGEGRNIYSDSKEFIAPTIAEIWGGKLEQELVLYTNIGSQNFNGEKRRVDGKSGWLAPITRAEAAAMIVDCLEGLSIETIPVTDNIESVINDWDENHSPDSTYEHYNTVKGSVAKEKIKKLYSAGIATGDENHDFHPQYNIKRQDLSVLVYKTVNKNKRTPLNVAPKQETPKPDNATFDIHDAGRRDLVEGDKLTVDGKTYEIKAGVGGVLGEGLPIGIDSGRTLTKVNETLTVGVVSDGTVGRLGDKYVACPTTGEAHFRDDWDKIMDAYTGIQQQKGKGTQGETVQVGLNGWLTLQFFGEGWVSVTPDWM